MSYQISFLQSKNIPDWFDIFVNGIYIQFVTSYDMHWGEFPTQKELIKKYYNQIRYYKYNKKEIEILNKKHKKRIMNRCKRKQLWTKEYSYHETFTFLKNII